MRMAAAGSLARSLPSAWTRISAASAMLPSAAMLARPIARVLPLVAAAGSLCGAATLGMAAAADLQDPCECAPNLPLLSGLVPLHKAHSKPVSMQSCGAGTTSAPRRESGTLVSVTKFPIVHAGVGAAILVILFSHCAGTFGKIRPRKPDATPFSQEYWGQKMHWMPPGGGSGSPPRTD